MKTIKHNNVLQPNPGERKEGYQFFSFTCRGCTMQNRERLWHGFASSISSKIDKENDNSYLSLEEEPGNRYDPNAIKVVCRGEFFGTVGYVGREYTAEVKKILRTCKSYRVEVVDMDEIGDSQIELLLTWKG